MEETTSHSTISSCNSISGVAIHFFTSWAIFLLPTTIRRVGQVTMPTHMAMGNCSKRAKELKTVTALSWRNTYLYVEINVQIFHIFSGFKRYSADHYRNKANYLSNPDVKFMGEETGSWDEDNARVITETRFRSAAVGDESATISEYVFTF